MLERDEILKKFSYEQLIEEAECVEECGEWLHMSLMGYGAKELYELAELVKARKEAS